MILKRNGAGSTLMQSKAGEITGVDFHHSSGSMKR
jgi:hypothetical protein